MTITHLSFLARNYPLILNRIICRYMVSIETITNAEARELLKLPEKDRSKVSRLFAELVAANEIVQTRGANPNDVKYKRLQKE